MSNLPTIKKTLSNKNGARDVSERWWEASDTEVAHNISATVKAITAEQIGQTTDRIKYARLYSDRELIGMISTDAAAQASKTRNIANRITYNVVKACTDTVQAKIAKNKPKVQFLTSGGNWTQQERAKKLTKYVEGVFYDTDMYTEAQRVFIHACVLGTGVIKFYPEDGKIKAESVFIEEIKVDEVEGLYGNPRSLHQTKHVARDILLAQFPEEATAIHNAPRTQMHGISSSADVVEVIESWHLPTGKDAKDGRHVISVEDGTLMDEVYEKTYFPFVFFRWSERLTGFFGQGLAEELIGFQIEINKILRNIQKAMHLISVPRIGVDARTKISSSMISNEIGSIFKYTGTPPQFFNAQAMTSEVYDHLKWLISESFAKTGISQLSASSQKPAGLDAAVALREMQDIETDRFMITAQRYEKMFLDAAEIIVDLSRDLYAEDPKLDVKIQSSKFIETIKWKDVDLDESQFTMKMFPVSLLPTRPEGRLQKVQEMINSGMLDKETAMALLDFPDLEEFQSIQGANMKLIKKVLFEITEKGKYHPPEPQMDLEMAAKMAQGTYLKSRIDNLPEERQALLLRFIDDADRLKGLAAPAPIAPELPADPTVNPAQGPAPTEVLTTAPLNV